MAFSCFKLRAIFFVKTVLKTVSRVFILLGTNIKQMLMPILTANKIEIILRAGTDRRITLYCALTQTIICFLF